MRRHFPSFHQTRRSTFKSQPRNAPRTTRERRCVRNEASHWCALRRYWPCRSRMGLVRARHGTIRGSFYLVERDSVHRFSGSHAGRTSLVDHKALLDAVAAVDRKWGARYLLFSSVHDEPTRLRSGHAESASVDSPGGRLCCSGTRIVVGGYQKSHPVIICPVGTREPRTGLPLVNRERHFQWPQR